MKAVLQSEAGLVEEIDYDLRRFQKEEQEKREKAKVIRIFMFTVRDMCSCRPAMYARYELQRLSPITLRKEESHGNKRKPRRVLR